MSMLHICFQLSISGGVSAKINSIIQIPGPSYIIRYIYIYEPNINRTAKLAGCREEHGSEVDFIYIY